MSLASVSNSVVAPTSTASLSQLSNNHESFLNLLVAQVRHQDPLEPLDGTQFISQLATLTQVEQSVKMNAQMESLRSQLAVSAALAESALIGRQVMVPSEVAELGPEGAAFSYELQSSADSVTAIITDASGNPVRRIDGLPGTPGTLIDVEWDGTDENGDPLPPGLYGVSLAAGGLSGGYNTYSSFEVASVSFEAGQQRLDFTGGGWATSDEIVRIE